MRTHVLTCAAGCGRTNTVTVPNDAPFNAGVPWRCAFDDPNYRTPEQVESDITALKNAESRAAFEKSIDSIRTTKGDIQVLVDPDPTDAVPGFWRSLWDTITGK